MSKFSGMIGFGWQEEDPPGIWRDVLIERKYTGDILKNNQRYAVSNTTTGELQITNNFSIVGDSYAFAHVGYIKYLYWRGNRWLVNTIDIEYPRLIMTIGGLYNGPQTDSTEDFGEC